MSRFHPTKRESMSNQINTPALVQTRKKFGSKDAKKSTLPPLPPAIEEYVDAELGAIVIDNGSGYIKGMFGLQ